MNLTFKQYRAIDLTIMAVLIAIAEAVTTLAATKWFPSQLFNLSPAIALVCIVMMRWDGYAVIHAALSGCVFCLAMGAEPSQFAVYCIGNCGMLAALILFKFFDKQKVRDSIWLTLIFTVIAYLGAELGRWGVTLIFGGSLESVLALLSGDCISLLFAVIVTLISRRMDGLFEDQRSYLLRLNEEREKERLEREKQDRYYYD